MRKKGEPQLTLADQLEVLDGVMEMEGRMLVITTTMTRGSLFAPRHVQTLPRDGSSLWCLRGEASRPAVDPGRGDLGAPQQHAGPGGCLEYPDQH